jgi:hypothetical protein
MYNTGEEATYVLPSSRMKGQLRLQKLGTQYRSFRLVAASDHVVYVSSICLLQQVAFAILPKSELSWRGTTDKQT